MQLQFAEILMYQQKHYKVLRSELWDFCRSFLQISEQENHQEKLQTDGPKTKNEFYECYICMFQDLLTWPQLFKHWSVLSVRKSLSSR